MCLHDLINDRKAQPCSAFEPGLQRLKNLRLLFGVKTHARITKRYTQPERPFIHTHRQFAAIRHRAQRVVAQVPEHLPDSPRIHTRLDFLPVVRFFDLIFGSHFRFLLDEHQRFFKQRSYVRFFEFIRLLARIIQEVRNDLVQPLRFPANDIHEMLFVLFHGNHPAQLTHRTRHSRQRLPNFVRDSRRKPSQGRHALFRCDLLLEPAQVRQILKIKNIPAAIHVPRPQRRYADADVSLLAILRLKFNLASCSGFFSSIHLPGQPKLLVPILQLQSAHLGEPLSQNFLSGPVQKRD